MCLIPYILSHSSHLAVIPLDTRHYVLPSGDLLIASVRSADVRRQFRCKVAHLITGERFDSINWARIKLTGNLLDQHSLQDFDVILLM